MKKLSDIEIEKKVNKLIKTFNFDKAFAVYTLLNKGNMYKTKSDMISSCTKLATNFIIDCNKIKGLQSTESGHFRVSIEQPNSLFFLEYVPLVSSYA